MPFWAHLKNNDPFDEPKKMPPRELVKNARESLPPFLVCKIVPSKNGFKKVVTRTSGPMNSMLLIYYWAFKLCVIQVVHGTPIILMPNSSNMLLISS